jgi:ketosteroid isomerase-like protein
MFKSIILILGISFASPSGFRQSANSITQFKKPNYMESSEIVNKYLNIIFVENNNGAGLSDILAEDFVFNDPFTKALSAKDFIDNPATQNWIKTRKKFRMEKQLIIKNSVCSLYSIDVQTPNGNTETFQLNDYVELNDGKISKERVYFFDPLKFAKAMGFFDSYVKAYQ